MTEKKYIGITIGPIGDTMAVAKTPAMLWYASAIFSRLSYLLCCEISTIPGAKILVPYIADGSPSKANFPADGIGKYHDRVIFNAPAYDDLEQKITNAIFNAKATLAEMISKDSKRTHRNQSVCASDNDIAFLMQYIQAPFVILEDEDLTDEKGNTRNCILAASDYLDALERMRTFEPDNNRNVLTRLFNKEMFNSRNYSIKVCEMLDHVQNTKLFLDNSDSFRDIQSIADPKNMRNTAPKHLKAYHYYAVIKVDGDKMGAHLKEKKSDEEVIAFSERCIRYATEASRVVESYGGMVIYAGGDDLLALAPLYGDGENNTAVNILKLCDEIDTTFNNTVRENPEDSFPSVSISVTVRYEKFPLYEALNSADTNLLYKAKAQDKKQKHYIAFDFKKHSGQKVNFLVPFERLNEINDIFTAIDSDGKQLETVNSIIYILDTFKEIIKESCLHGDETVLNVFRNLYDNAGQVKYTDYVKYLAGKFNKLRAGNESGRVITLFKEAFDKSELGKESKAVAARDIKTFEGLLRVRKFVTEEQKIVTEEQKK